MGPLKKWWDRYRQFRAAQGLASDILDFLGWKKSLFALGVALITAVKARLAHLAGVEQFVLFLGALASGLVILNLGAPYVVRLRGGRKTHPAIPILACRGHGSLNLGELIVYTAAVSNIQHETANRADDAWTRLEYYNDLYCAGGKPIAIEPGGWLPSENSEPMKYAANSDILSERFKNALYAIGRNGQQGVFLPSPGRFELGEKCSTGVWRVLISVIAKDLQPFRFGIQFRVNRDENFCEPFLVRESRNFANWLRFKRNDP